MPQIWCTSRFDLCFLRCMGVWQGVAIVSQMFCPGLAKPDPPCTPCGWPPLMSLACGWYYWRSFFLLLGVGQRLPHALGTACAKTFRLDCGLKSVVVQTKYDLPKVTFFLKNAMFQTRAA
jgi:hypothetical protein